MASMEPNDEVVLLELPAPSGWKKTVSLKKGGTPNKNAAMFTSPTGEELKNPKQLKQYLKSHPGGPKISEFDWGSGETPRRSSRISEKEKSTPPSLEPEPVKKRARKSSSSKKTKKEEEEEEEDEKDVEVKDSEKGDGKSEIPEMPLSDNPVKDVDMKESEKAVEDDEKPKEEEIPQSETVKEAVEEMCEIPKVPSEQITKPEEQDESKPDEVNEEVGEIPKLPSGEVEVTKPDESEVGESEPVKEVVEESCEIPKVPSEEVAKPEEVDEAVKEEALENPKTPPPENAANPASANEEQEPVKDDFKVEAGGGAAAENGCPVSEGKTSWEEIKIE